MGKIFEKYQQWIASETFHCHRGCSLCCTQNVMITAVEGQLIYNYVRRENREQWFAEKLQLSRPASMVKWTTNGFARICLAEQEDYGEEEQQVHTGICPFLEENCCPIYEVRPFSCRSFASTRDCMETGTAQLSERLVAVNTVTLQLLEHLGQRGYWGNMLDVLLALANHPGNEVVRQHIRDDAIIQTAIKTTLTAEPIPGFLLTPEVEKEINQYLQAVLSTKVGMKSIENIFNNK